MNNPHANWSASPTSPARMALEVTPDDATDLPETAKALRIWNPSDAMAAIAVQPVSAGDGDAPVVLMVPPGLTVEPLAVRRVLATGTDGALVVHAYSR